MRLFVKTLVVLCISGFSTLLFFHNFTTIRYFIVIPTATKYAEPKSRNLTFSSVYADDHTFRFEKSYTINNNQSVVIAKYKFDTKWNVHLKRLGLLNVANDADAKSVLYSDPIFVTAFSSNHFSEGLTMLRFLTVIYPNEKKIYVYNLGMSQGEKRKLHDKYDGIIIDLIDFPFNEYPEYVKSLNEYRWKPLIIADILTRHQSLWWIDTSTQITGTLNPVYDDFRRCAEVIADDGGDPSRCQYYPWVTVDNGGHSIFATTQEKMFDYLPIPDIPKKNLTMVGANVQLIYGLRHAKENVLRYWVLCALEEGCMAPSGSHLYCQWSGNRYTKYAHCHRYDQSALTILLAWVNGFTDSRYRHYANGVVKVVRQ